MRIVFLLLILGFLSKVIAQPTFNIIQEYGGYIFCAATADDRDAIIYKLDNNLKTVFTYEFTDTLLRSNFDYRILEIENGFVVYGTTQKQNYQVVGFVRRIDSLGNLRWNKEFLYSGSNNFVSDVVLLNDSTLVMNNVVEKR